MDKLIALSAATLILVAIPGPNVALIVANSVRYGLRIGVITVFGTTLGVAVQLCIVLLGLAALIEIAADALFLPQFVSVDGNASAGLMLVAAVFLTVLLLGDLLWVALAGSAKRLLARQPTARNKITGGFLILASIGLALSRRS